LRLFLFDLPFLRLFVLCSLFLLPPKLRRDRRGDDRAEIDFLGRELLSSWDFGGAGGINGFISARKRLVSWDSTGTSGDEGFISSSERLLSRDSSSILDVIDSISTEFGKEPEFTLDDTCSFGGG
jgi:hypothetical protein